RKTLFYSVTSAVLASLYAGAVTLLARIMENQAIAPGLSLDIFNSFTSNPKFYSVSYLIGFVAVLGMGIFVGLAKPRKPEARLWAILSFLVAIWSIGRFKIIGSVTPEQAFFWQRFTYVGAIYLNVVYYHFAVTFIGKSYDRKVRALLICGYTTATVLVLSNLLSHLFISTMLSDQLWKYYEYRGPLYPIHVGLYALYPGLGMLGLLRHRLKTEGSQRNQIDYVIVASVIGFFCGATTFPYIFGINF